MLLHSRLISRRFVFAVASTIVVACNTQQSPANQAQVNPVAQTQPAVCAPVTSDAPAALEKKPGYRQVAISVMDESGREVQNLHKDDFIAKIADEPIPILFTEYQSNGPVSVLILADTSGSTGLKLPQTREAVSQLVKNLDPRDDAALFAVSGKPFLLQPFTQDHSIIIERAKIFHAYGSTSLFDGVITATTMLNRGCYARRVLVVISDGMDNTSGYSLTDATDHIKSNSVSAYAIAIGSSDSSGHSGLVIGPFMTNADSDSMDEKTLGHLTCPSGGSTFSVNEQGDHAILAAAAKSIMEGSRGQYVVGFANPRIDPALVTIQIKNHEDYLLTRQKIPPTASPPTTQASPPAHS